MASFVTDLWESIFTPGPTATLLKATNITFAALQLLLFILLIVTYSIHFAVLSVLSGGLWWAINWFAAELEAAKARGEIGTSDDKKEQQEQPTGKEPSEGVKANSDGEDTEVEEKSRKQSRRGKAKQAAEGPVRRRKSERLSNVSTEDEWEKVSGAE